MEKPATAILDANGDALGFYWKIYDGFEWQMSPKWMRFFSVSTHDSSIIGYAKTEEDAEAAIRERAGR